MSFEIRSFHPQDFLIVREWLAQQKWNPGVYDYLAFQRIDRQGFWMGTLDGQPIAAIAACQYDSNFASVSWFIVKPQHRNKRYGTILWNKATSRLNAKNIVLSCGKQNEYKYEKLGYKKVYNRIRYKTFGTNHQFNSQNLTDCRQLSIQDLCKYDRNNFPAERKDFLQKWINLPQSKSIAYLREKQILGYGVLRQMYQGGYHIGPLFANTYEIAFQIIKNLIGFISKDKIIQIDILELNQNALKLVQQFHMKQVFYCSRMQTNPDTQTQQHFLKTVYGVTTLPFG